MVNFGTSEGEAQVGLFAVAKKNGKQRLVIDCRHANCHFSDSEPVHLPTSASLSRLGMNSGDKLYVGQYDLCDAFYQF